MTDLDQEGISGRLRARFSTYQDGPPRRRYLVLAIVVVVLGLAGYAGYLLYYWHYHISTDDAYITARIAPMSARIPGIVIEVAVNDNQDVKADQVLVRLDPRDYEVAVAQARAAVASAKGDLETAVAGVPLTDESTRSLVQQADAALGATQFGTEMARHDLEERRGVLQAKQAAVAAADAAVRAAQADYERSKNERDRMASLVKSDSRRAAGVGARGRHVQDRGGDARRVPQAARSVAQRGRPGRGVAARAAGRHRPVGEPDGREPRVAAERAQPAPAGAAAPGPGRGGAGPARAGPREPAAGGAEPGLLHDPGADAGPREPEVGGDGPGGVDRAGAPRGGGSRRRVGRGELQGDRAHPRASRASAPP